VADRLTDARTTGSSIAVIPHHSFDADCSLIKLTPGDDCSSENEMRLFSRVEDLDEHTVHVVSLDSVPEQRHENEVVAENVGEAAAQA